MDGWGSGRWFLPSLLVELSGGIARDPWVNDSEARIHLVEKHGDKALDDTDRHGVAEEMEGAVGLGTRPGDAVPVSMGAGGFRYGHVPASGSNPVASVQAPRQRGNNGPGGGTSK